MSTTEKRFSASVACEVAGVIPVTLRSWRNKNGLLADPNRSGWNRFSLVDLCVVRLVAQLTQSGFSAENAVGISDHIALTFRILLDGGDFSTTAWVTTHSVVYADEKMTVGEYKDRPEVSIFLDLKAIIYGVFVALQRFQSDEFVEGMPLRSIAQRMFGNKDGVA